MHSRALRIAWALLLTVGYGYLVFLTYKEAGLGTAVLATGLLLRLELIENYQLRLRSAVNQLAEAAGTLAGLCGQHAATTEVLHQRVQAIEASLDREAGLN